MKRQILIVLSLVLLVGAFVAAAAIYRADKTQAVTTLAQEQSELFVPAYSMRMGDPTARVTIVEFFDPACETCAQFAPVLKAMVDQNPGRVQLVERYAPFHPGSEAVVAALEAARQQDRYWETLEIMFSTQAVWASHHDPQPDRLWALLERGGLDMTRLAQDMNDPMVKMIIQQDLQDAKQLGVTQTPEFFVNGKPLPSWGMDQLKALVKSELDAQY